MRNVAKSMLAAAVAAVAMSSAASALTVLQVADDIRKGTFGDAPAATYYAGDIVIKYVNYDVGRIYTEKGPKTYGRATDSTLSDAAAIADVDTAPSTALPGSTFDPGEDGWGILRVDTIYDATQTRALWSRTLSPYEITGMFWGLQDTYLDIQGAATQHIHAVGFESGFWADSSKNFDPTGGPSARSGTASYPTVSDGVLLWTGVGLAGSADTNYPKDEFLTTFNPAAGPGSPNVGDGKVDGDFATNAAGTGGGNYMFLAPAGEADWSVKFTGISPPSGSPVSGWLVQSNDPLVTTIPTPSAVWGGAILAGFVGANVIRRRRAQ